MNVIIMCFCYLLFNLLCFEAGNALKNHRSRLECGAVGGGTCLPYKKAKMNEQLQLANELLSSSKETASRGGERLQLAVAHGQTLEMDSSTPKKSPRRPRNSRKKNRRRHGPNRRKDGKGRHSRNKYFDRRTDDENPSKLKKTFEAQSHRDETHNLYFPIHNFRDFLTSEVASVKNKTTLEFRNRNIGKGLLKGGSGRRRRLNPHRGAKKVIVRTHNVLRGRVWPPAQNMLAVSWSTEAAEQAQVWADECRLGLDADHASVRWTHMYGTCGQNVHIAFKKKRWGRVVRHWWNERRNFRFGEGGNNVTRIGKYTQMAWYNSHKVGCGFAQCGTPSGKTFFRYVCNYCPSGNDPRRLSRPYDEGQQCGACPSSCRSVCNRGGCKLCTNSCAFADLWANCESLAFKWKQWLCNTKTRDGVARFKNCRATCQCQDKIT